MAHSKLVKFIESNDFASGTTSVVAYSTAWAARVKKADNPSEPAFPEALEWLRNNQLSDGSWGAAEVFTIFDRMLSTFTAVVALKEWNLEKDQSRIDNAVKFIKENWQKLIFYGRIPWQMTVGFELIFPSLHDQAIKLLDIDEFGSKDVLENYTKARDKKLKKIRKMEQKEKDKKEGKKDEKEGEKVEKEGEKDEKEEVRYVEGQDLWSLR